MGATLPVLVLGFHHGSLGIARSLGRLGVAVYGTDADPAAPGLASRYCRGAFPWDFSSASPGDSLAFLLRTARTIGGPVVLIPTSDDLAFFVATHADALAENFLFPRQDRELVRAFSDKRRLYHLARTHDVPTPETAFPACRAEVVAFARTATFPLMLKGIDGLRLQARTGKKMVIVGSVDELLEWYDRLEEPAAPNLMLQEYIPGGDDTIWMFNGYFDAHSECVAGFTGKKIRQHPVHMGATSLGICLANPDVSSTTVRFMKAVGYRGILDIGFRFDARDGQYKLLDPNPRIGSTFRLFVGRDGMDVVRYLYRDMTGQPLPASVPTEGRRWVVEDRDLEAVLDYRREGSLSISRWLLSYRGVREGAWFAWDDPVPFLRMAGGLLRRGLRWLVRRGAPSRTLLGRAPSTREAIH